MTGVVSLVADDGVPRRGRVGRHNPIPSGPVSPCVETVTRDRAEEDGVPRTTGPLGDGSGRLGFGCHTYVESGPIVTTGGAVP